MALPTEGPNDERRRTMTKRDGIASDHLPLQAAATLQDELVAGLSRNPESIPSPALLAQVLDRANLRRALKQVRQNKGAPGLDGMTVEALPDDLRHHWPEIREQLETGSYRPQPVKRVEIDKADGKKRPLGIPTVLDRFLQQAIAQVISALWEPHFHPRSYGFRPKRSAHQAVRAVQANIRAGYHWVVDLDLQAFFDRVNHDRLLARLKSRCPDADLLRLINRFLKAGVSIEGQIQPTPLGVPQGGPLSPVLANVVLDELDWELDRRGHCFARYADDCNILVKSKRAGERVMASVTRFVSDSLRLTVNPLKKRGRSAHEPQIPGLHGQPQRRPTQGGRQGPRQAQGPCAGTDPSDKRHPFRRRRRRASRNPAWLESVLRNHRGAQPSSRPRQVGPTQVTLLSLETMGSSGLSGTAQTRRVCA